MNYLKKARKYVANNTIPESKKCRFHLTPETGWLNDPNGFSIYNNKFQMFYQFYPYNSQWGSMHWGHCESDDLIKWSYKPVALAPQYPTENGNCCYSGSGIVKDNKHYLIFTQNGIGQKTCIAYSNDGIDYKRINKPVITSKDLPKDMSIFNCRDPKVFERNGKYYLLLGCKNKSKNVSCNVLLFSSNDLFSWSYIGKLFDDEICKKEFDTMVECPDFFTIDGKDVIIVSPWRKCKVLYSIGKLDLTSGKFIGTPLELVDYGTDYFATQSTEKDDNTYLTAWAQPTDSKTSVTKSTNFNGILTLPRQVNIIDDKLYQMPPKSLNNYRINHTSFNGNIDKVYNTKLGGEFLDIELSINNLSNGDGIVLYSDNKNKGVKIYYDNGMLIIDRKDNYNCNVKSDKEYTITTPITVENNYINLRIILDRFILEVFVNDGEKAFSTLVSPTKDRQNVCLISNNNGEFNFNGYNIK